MQCKSKLLSTETVLPNFIGVSQASTGTNKLILNNYSNSGNISSQVIKNTNPFIDTTLISISIILCIDFRKCFERD